MLGNFAAGVFAQVLRPYQGGRLHPAPGAWFGTKSKSWSLFATTVVTPDNVVYRGRQGKVFGDNIQN